MPNVSTNVPKLAPEDYVIFSGYGTKDGQPCALWTSLVEAIQILDLPPDGVTISISEHGALSVKPNEKMGGLSSMSFGPGFWSETANLVTHVI